MCNVRVVLLVDVVFTSLHHIAPMILLHIAIFTCLGIASFQTFEICRSCNELRGRIELHEDYDFLISGVGKE